MFGLSWAVLVGAGLGVMGAYGQVSGAVGAIPSQWPEASRLAHAGRSTLLIFLHPECGCSRASVGELDRVLAHASSDVDTHAIFIKPKKWSDEKVRGELWEQAGAIPGVRLHVDADSHEAKLFGAKTSGHTILFDPQGRRVFSGGITPSRGHMGDNVGQLALVDLLNGLKKEESIATRVFGCGLFGGEFINRKVLAFFSGATP